MQVSKGGCAGVRGQVCVEKRERSTEISSYARIVVKWFAADTKPTYILRIEIEHINLKVNTRLPV